MTSRIIHETEFTDVEKIGVFGTTPIGYTIPESIIRSITEGLNGVLPNAKFMFKYYKGGDIYEWSTKTPNIVTITLSKSNFNLYYFGFPTKEAARPVVESVKKVFENVSSRGGSRKIRKTRRRL